MLDKINPTLSFFTDALRLRAKRQEVLSSNLANADTPNYQARDFKFAQTMTKAHKPFRFDMKQTAPQHLEGTNKNVMNFQLLYRHPQQMSIDNNTVETDIEFGHYSKNALHYQQGLTYLSHELKMLYMGVKGQ